MTGGGPSRRNRPLVHTRCMLANKHHPSPDNLLKCFRNTQPPWDRHQLTDREWLPALASGRHKTYDHSDGKRV